MDFTWIELAKVIVGVLAIFQIIMSYRAQKIESKRMQRSLVFFLLFLTFVSIGLHQASRTLIRKQDFFLLYMGAKYLKESGYANQYKNVAIAMEEMGLVEDKNEQIRDLHTNEFITFEQILKDKTPKQAFSPDRWESFKKDTRFLYSNMPASKWKTTITDTGYHNTPVWSLIGSPIANLLPVDNKISLSILVSLDIIIQILMFGFIWWAFGSRVMMLSLVFYCLDLQSIRLASGSFLKFMWFVSSVVSICLLKKKKMVWGGAMLAFAALTRIFPLVLVFGMIAKFCLSLMKKQKIKPYIKFFTGYCLVSLVLLGCSFLFIGTQHWKEYYKKIALHKTRVEALVGVVAGINNLYVMGFHKPPEGTSDDDFRQMQLERYERKKLIYSAIYLICILCCFYLSGFLEYHETVSFSFILIFFTFLIPTYYYPGFLIVLLFFAPREQRLEYVLGTILMFLYVIGTYAIIYLGPHIFRITSIYNSMILFILLYMAGLVFMRKKKPLCDVSR